MSARQAVIAGLLLLALGAQLAFALRLIAGAALASDADAALFHRDFPAAAAGYMRAVQFVSFRGDWDYALAGAVRESQGDSAAVPIYERGLHNAPYAEETMVAAAESLINVGRREQAIALLDRAAAVTPFDWRVHYLYGVVATVEGRPADAVEALLTAEGLSTGANATILNPLANALVSTGNFVEAALRAEQALFTQPANPAHQLVRGKALLGLGEAAQALDAFSASAEGYRKASVRGESVEGPLAEAQEGVAFALMWAGRAADAIDPLEQVCGRSAAAAYRAAQRLEPWLTETGSRAPVRLWELAIYGYIEGENTGAAARMVAEAERLHPALTERLVPARAHLLVAAGQPDEALMLLRNAADTAEGSPEFQLAFASVHAALGNPATASLEARALLDRRDLTPIVRRRATELAADGLVQ